MDVATMYLEDPDQRVENVNINVSNHQIIVEATERCFYNLLYLNVWLNGSGSGDMSSANGCRYS